MEQNNIKSKVSEWFETSIRYNKTFEDGKEKAIAEKYVVEAVCFTEAENTIVEEMMPYISGEYKVITIQRAPYSEIFSLLTAEMTSGIRSRCLS